MPATSPSADQHTHALVTIGYEGRSLGGFIAELRDMGIVVVVDVRELPLSRRRGFSKRHLREELASAGIDYVHMRPLGSPRPVRRKLHEDGDYDAFFAAYAAHLNGQQAAMHQLLALIETTRVCLLCYEAEAERCHRSLLASRLEGAVQSHVEVVHQ